MTRSAADLIVAMRRAAPLTDLPDPAEQRRLRRAAGLTQYDVAEAIQATQKGVSLFERGVGPRQRALRSAYLHALGAMKTLAA
jgi:hypothetical protein